MSGIASSLNTLFNARAKLFLPSLMNRPSTPALSFSYSQSVSTSMAADIEALGRKTISRGGREEGGRGGVLAIGIPEFDSTNVPCVVLRGGSCLGS
jgi:hypothetical protein